MEKQAKVQKNVQTVETDEHMENNACESLRLKAIGVHPVTGLGSMYFNSGHTSGSWSI